MTQNSSPLLWIGLLLVIAVVLVMVYAIWQIGSDFLRTLALILVIATAVALVTGASALPIRAWRRKDQTGETHFVHDGTRTIVKETRLDGRMIEAPRLYQLPPQNAGMAFPDLLRAAYQGGAQASRSSTAVPTNGYSAYAAADLPEIGPEPDGWEGDINQ